MRKLFVYSRAGCSGCIELKARLTEEGHDFEVRPYERVARSKRDKVDELAFDIWLNQDTVLPVLVDVDLTDEELASLIPN